MVIANTGIQLCDHNIAAAGRRVPGGDSVDAGRLRGLLIPLTCEQGVVGQSMRETALIHFCRFNGRVGTKARDRCLDRLAGSGLDL